MGKLPTEDLKKLLGYIKKDAKVVVSPRHGFDAGVHELNEAKYLVVSSDPCIGVPEEWFGWLLIHYVASDIALFGAQMEFCSINLLGPLGTKPKFFQKIMEQTCKVANELRVNIVTGHTGSYQGLSTMVGVCTGYGYVGKDRLITPGGAKPEDYILCIKPLGLETVVNFALSKKSLAEELFGIQRVKELINLTYLQSCVNEAISLAKVEGVHAMHDATEGGILASLNEMADASNVGFKINWNQILFQKEIKTLSDYFDLSDLQLLSISSSGTILVAVSPDNICEVQTVLHKIGVEMRLLGVFTKKLKRVLVQNRKEILFPQEPDDPYVRIVSKDIKH